MRTFVAGCCKREGSMRSGRDYSSHGNTGAYAHSPASLRLSRGGEGGVLRTAAPCAADDDSHERNSSRCFDGDWALFGSSDAPRTCGTQHTAPRRACALKRGRIVASCAAAAPSTSPVLARAPPRHLLRSSLLRPIKHPPSSVLMLLAQRPAPHVPTLKSSPAGSRPPKLCPEWAVFPLQTRAIASSFNT
eukprot:5728228-Pleurochrysis_carterae.AAC.2